MKVFCILGDERVYRTKSPELFTAMLKRQGMRGYYAPFKVDPKNVGQAMQSLKVFNIAGANVTVPYKEAVVPHMNIMSEGANVIGAVNTIVINGNELKGYNTNAIGIMDALSDANFDVADKSALVVGTGGVAKAAVFVLNWQRTRTVYVAGRNAQKTNALVTRFGGQAEDLYGLAGRPLPVHIVVNTTSVSSPTEAPEMAELVKKLDLPECELILDLNYGREDNFWGELARSKNIPFMDGITPLVYQARRTFSLWTGLQIPADDVRKTIEEHLAV